MANLEREEMSCRHCGNLILESSSSPTGWTHGREGWTLTGWQGKRCPGGLTGAEPEPEPLFDAMVSKASKNHPEDEVRCILADAGVHQLLLNLREIAKHAEAALGEQRA